MERAHFHLIATGVLAVALLINFVNDAGPEAAPKEELAKLETSLITEIDERRAAEEQIGLRVNNAFDGIRVTAESIEGGGWKLNEGIARAGDVPVDVAQFLDSPAVEAMLDNDGIVWSKDECPDLAGVIDNETGDYNGCPIGLIPYKSDADKDGVPDDRDADDATPIVADDPKTVNVEAASVIDQGSDTGWKSQIFVNPDDGRADSDQDGVADQKDVCPNSTDIAVNNKGCFKTEIGATCSWDSDPAKDQTAADGKSGTSVSVSCAGADEPNVALSIKWSVDDKGVVKYEAPEKWVAPAPAAAAEAPATPPAGPPPPPGANAG